MNQPSFHRESHRRRTRRRERCGILLFIAFDALLFSGRAEASLQEARRQGEKAFSAAQYENAFGFFQEAEREAIESKQDPAFARINQALALSRLGRDAEAIPKYTAALETTDLEMQARAQYALGTLSGRSADATAGKDDPGAAKGYEQALQRLESSLRLASTNVDAKINYELAKARLTAVKRRIEERKKQQQKPPDPSKPEDAPKPEPSGSSGPKPQDSAKPDPQKSEASESAEKSEDPSPSTPPSPASEDGKDAAPEKSSAPAKEKPEGEMTEEEAKMILDALREEEGAQRQQMRVRRGDPQPVDKDW